MISQKHLSFLLPQQLPKHLRGFYPLDLTFPYKEKFLKMCDKKCDFIVSCCHITILMILSQLCELL